MRQGLSNAHLSYIMDKLMPARWQLPMEKNQNWIRIESIFYGAQRHHEKSILKTSFRILISEHLTHSLIYTISKENTGLLSAID